MTHDFKNTLALMLAIGIGLVFALGVHAATIDGSSIFIYTEFKDGNLIWTLSPPAKAINSPGSPSQQMVPAGQYFTNNHDHFIAGDVGSTSAVPEPSTVILLSLGLASLAVWRWKKGMVG